MYKRYHTVEEFQRDYPDSNGLNFFSIRWCIEHRGYFSRDKKSQRFIQSHREEIIGGYVAEIEQAHKSAAKSKLRFNSGLESAIV